MTVLFADLVDFTARAETLDPEEGASPSGVRAACPTGRASAPELRFRFGRALHFAGDDRARPHEAFTRQRAADQLVAQDRRAAADVQLGQELALRRSVGASRYIRECESMLARTA